MIDFYSTIGYAEEVDLTAETTVTTTVTELASSLRARWDNADNKPEEEVADEKWIDLSSRKSVSPLNGNSLDSRYSYSAMNQKARKSDALSDRRNMVKSYNEWMELVADENMIDLEVIDGLSEGRQSCSPTIGGNGKRFLEGRDENERPHGRMKHTTESLKCEATEAIRNASTEHTSYPLPDIQAVREISVIERTVSDGIQSSNIGNGITTLSDEQKQ